MMNVNVLQKNCIALLRNTIDLNFMTTATEKVENKSHLDLVQLAIFLVVELTYSYSNPTRVLYLWLIILLVRGNIPVDSDVLLVTDSVNLKIKSV
jgi:hypothetical protein